jgi:hypothetical protein
MKCIALHCRFIEAQLLNSMGFVYFGTGITGEDFKMVGIWLQASENMVKDTAGQHNITLWAKRCDLH